MVVYQILYPVLLKSTCAKFLYLRAHLGERALKFRENLRAASSLRHVQVTTSQDNGEPKAWLNFSKFKADNTCCLIVSDMGV